MTLECASCGIAKNITEFPKDARKKHGVGSECKKCFAARAKAKRRGITCVRVWSDTLWQCKECNITKELSIVNFYTVKGRLTKFDDICRDCRNAYHVLHRQKNYDSPQRAAKRSTASIKERKTHQSAKIDCIVYKGSVCAKCGIKYDGTNGMIFDFHHIDPTNKSFEILKSGKKTLDSQIDELDKCILLCANCHRQEHSDIF